MSLFPIAYIPLKEHSLALAAVRQVCRGRATLPAVLSIHGAAGFGKTALLNAIAEHEQALPGNSGLFVERIDATDLLRQRFGFDDPRREFSAQVPHDTSRYLSDASAPKNKFSTLHTQALPAPLELNGQSVLLICDDIHRLRGHESAQRYLVRLIDAVLAHGGVVIVTGLRPVGEIRGLSPRLVSRCRGGATVRLEIPDIDSRRMLIESFCRHRRLSVTPAGIGRLTEILPAVPRELFASLMNLESAAVLQNRVALTPEFLQANFAVRTPPRRKLTLAAITKATAREYGLPPSAIRGESRKAKINRVRQMAMSLCRTQTPASLSAIGKYFGNRSHTAVKHACEVLAKELDSNPETKSCLRRILDRLKLEMD